MPYFLPYGRSMERQAWLTLVSSQLGDDDSLNLKAGESLTFEFEADREMLGHESTTTALISYAVSDDEYSQCFFDNVVVQKIRVAVEHPVDLNHLDSIGPIGLPWPP